jgi:hypothetical protein
MQVVFAIIKRQATSSSLLEAGDEYYQGKYEQAEPLCQRALAISEQALPPDHTDIATTLENYASLLSPTVVDDPVSSALFWREGLGSGSCDLQEDCRAAPGTYLG